MVRAECQGPRWLSRQHKRASPDTSPPRVFIPLSFYLFINMKIEEYLKDMGMAAWTRLKG